MKKAAKALEFGTEIVLSVFFLAILATTFVVSSNLNPQVNKSLNYDFKVLGKDNTVETLNVKPLLISNDNYQVSLLESSNSYLKLQIDILNNKVKKINFAEVENFSPNQQNFQLVFESKVELGNFMLMPYSQKIESSNSVVISPNQLNVLSLVKHNSNKSGDFRITVSLYF